MKTASLMVPGWLVVTPPRGVNQACSSPPSGTKSSGPPTPNTPEYMKIRPDLLNDLFSESDEDTRRQKEFGRALCAASEAKTQARLAKSNTKDAAKGEKVQATVVVDAERGASSHHRQCSSGCRCNTTGNCCGQKFMCEECNCLRCCCHFTQCVNRPSKKARVAVKVNIVIE